MSQSNPVYVSEALRQNLNERKSEQVIIEGDDEDRPPVVEFCVGREADLQALRETLAKVVFITGIGGEGKSTLAASYFTDSQNAQRFSFYVWRDCKEEEERFENQLASVVERLSRGHLSARDLAKLNIESIISLLLKVIGGLNVLFVFDNVDHYIDLEVGRITGSAGIFVDTLLRSDARLQTVFTCRPAVIHDHSEVLHSRLQGLSLEAAIELFAKRGAPSEPSEIDTAHAVTKGHAFWLDLLAVQVARRASVTDLTSMVREIQAGRGPLPENTLNSIWGTLHEREQTVLRAMAETVKPETVLEIAEYLRKDFGYSKTARALNNLRALNLVVVKRRPNMPDALELHPLVRQFIRRRFSARERGSFIDAIIKVYKRFIGSHKSELKQHPSLIVLQHWTQHAELDVAAGKFKDAFITLEEVADSFWGSAYAREFCRVARLLLSESQWVTDFPRYKGFEKVFRVLTENLSYLGEYVETDTLLDRYERTVAAKDARFIRYCGMRCHSKWVRGDFSNAIEWGETRPSAEGIYSGRYAI